MKQINEEKYGPTKDKLEARKNLEREIVLKKHQIYKKKKDEADHYKVEKNKNLQMARTFREESQR